MALTSLRQFAVILNVLAIYCAVDACSQPRHWQAEDASVRAIHADIVMVGKVMRSPQLSRQINATTFSPSGPYDARFRVFCALKGKLRAKYVDVSGFGYVPGHCVNSRALRNGVYITFLRRRRGRYFVAEMNSQIGTIPFKKSIFRKVVRKLRRSGQLNEPGNKLRRKCTAFLRTGRKSGKKSSEQPQGDKKFARKSDLTGTKSTDLQFGLTMSSPGGNGSSRFELSWFGVLMFGLHCANYLLTQNFWDQIIG